MTQFMRDSPCPNSVFSFSSSARKTSLGRKWSGFQTSFSDQEEEEEEEQEAQEEELEGKE